jgi:glutamate racemase
MKKCHKSARPIGVFDSGVGGLTVAREIIRQLPGEDIIYFGDTAHLPYGPKSEDKITKLSIINIKYLMRYGVKAVVIACNTTSALCIEKLKKRFSIPIIGVIVPGAKAAVKVTRNKRVGVIGTVGTIKSRAYEREIKKIKRGVKVYGKACPLFVPLVEEGWTRKPVTSEIAGEYLENLRKSKIDTLVLGCTHYPFLKKVISDTMGKGVDLIDSAEETANGLKNLLEDTRILNRKKSASRYIFFATDNIAQFKKVGKIFLGDKIRDVRLAVV